MADARVTEGYPRGAWLSRGCAFRWRAADAMSDCTDVERIRIAGRARAWRLRAPVGKFPLDG
jgi:hypothetical protein